MSSNKLPSSYVVISSYVPRLAMSNSMEAYVPVGIDLSLPYFLLNIEVKSNIRFPKPLLKGY